MSDGIFGGRFFGRAPAWHKFGVVNPDVRSIVEAVQLARMDYTIIKLVMAGQLETPMGTVLLSCSEKYGLFREPTDDDPEYRFLGNCSSEYPLIQNMDVARELEPLTELWPCETVGALDHGGTMFAALDAGEVMVNGELIHQYFSIVEPRDGKTAMKIVFTPVRWVCKNTLITGLRQAVVTSALRHTANLANAMQQRIAIVKRMQTAKDDVIEIFRKMGNMHIDGKELEYIFERAYPMPKKPAKADLIEILDADDESVSGIYGEAVNAAERWAYYCERALKMQRMAKELYVEIGEENPRIANTPWAAYNAVVESADYRDGEESVPLSSMFGDRAKEKQRAFAASMNCL